MLITLTVKMVSFFVTNKTLGSQLGIINALSCNSLWIAQTKDPFLPQYIYKLCRSYMQQPVAERKQYHPVKVIGKQPNHNVWVFNDDVQMDVDGFCIPINERRFILDGKRKDYLVNVSPDLDDGESLKTLLQAEKELFGNNFPQVLMVHAASSLCANFDLTIETFDGCGIPVLIGHPVSGKSTALKAVLSVFGDNTLVNNATKKYIESRQAATTIPFGWDDVSDPKLLGEIAVSSFNQAGSASVRGEHKPHTVPLVTTNLDSGHLKVKSRWFRIQFEELSPKLKGPERCQKEMALKAAMKTASKSISVVTSYIHKCITGIAEGDSDFQAMETVVEEACSAPSMADIDHRAQRQFSVMLFCCKKILDAVNMTDEIQTVKEKVTAVILPSYLKGSSGEQVNFRARFADKTTKVEILLHDKMPHILSSGNKNEVLGFFDQDFSPQCCGCGEVVTFHVSSLLNYLLGHGCEDAVGATEYSIRHFIKRSQIGCVGRQVKFRNATSQVSAAHIRRDWFDEKDIRELDACFGKRKKTAPRGVTKSNAAKSTSTKGDTTTIIQVVDEPQTVMEVDITGADDIAPTEATRTDADDIAPPTEAARIDAEDIAPPTEAARSDADDLAPPTEAARSDADDLAPPTEAARSDADDKAPPTEAARTDGRKRDVTSRLKDAWNDGKGVAGKRPRKQAKR